MTFNDILRGCARPVILPLVVFAFIGAGALAQSITGGGSGSGSGGAPSGPAGGSLGGTYPDPTVVTNANLTGDCTSVGNATTCTSISAVSQTSSWTSYTPSAVAQVGSMTGVGASGRYKQLGKTVFLQATVSITGVATGQAALLVSLPLVASGNATYVGSAYESAINGRGGIARIEGVTNATQVAARGADAVTFLSNNAVVNLGITYEIP